MGSFEQDGIQDFVIARRDTPRTWGHVRELRRREVDNTSLARCFGVENHGTTKLLRQMRAVQKAHTETRTVLKQAEELLEDAGVFKRQMKEELELLRRETQKSREIRDQFVGHLTGQWSDTGGSQTVANVSVPGNVIACASALRVLPSIEKAIGLVRQYFPTAKTISPGILADGGRSWVEIGVQVHGDTQDIRAQDDRFSSAWLDQTTPDERGNIQVTITVVADK